MSVDLGVCKKCGRSWHPPTLCWAYEWLDVETIERIAANIYNAGFYAWELDRAVLTWENEGGR